ncbi:hypothetical protein H0H92_008083 [Tricholoma furcatifolium]|nr:hypothetical protein H0H92_008083 [Tricholoma furcatifolium]
MAGRERTTWSDQEIRTLLQYLLEHKSEMGEATSFPMKTYTAAASVTGRNKTGAHVRTKWTMEASKSPETAEKAARRCEECPELVRVRSEVDGFTTDQQAQLLMYLSLHPESIDIYFGMSNPVLRQAVVMRWIASMPPLPEFLL